MPSVSLRISNTGIPRSANLFSSSSPNPPAVVLANNAVTACSDPNWSVVTAATSVNNVSSRSVGSMPAARNWMNVVVRSSTLN